MVTTSKVSCLEKSLLYDMIAYIHINDQLGTSAVGRWRRQRSGVWCVWGSDTLWLGEMQYIGLHFLHECSV